MTPPIPGTITMSFSRKKRNFEHTGSWDGRKTTGFGALAKPGLILPALMEAMCLSSLPPPLLNQPPQFEGNGRQSGVRTDGFPVEIAACCDMEPIFFRKTQIGGSLSRGMTGIEALQTVEPLLPQGTEGLLQSIIRIAQMVRVCQHGPAAGAYCPSDAVEWVWRSARTVMLSSPCG